MSRECFSRRQFIAAGALTLAGIAGILHSDGFAWADSAAAEATIPSSPRTTYSFNPNWKFIRADAVGADAVLFDEFAWSTVSTPHTYNDTDSFRHLISHGGGDRGTYQGIAWYRKHFILPPEATGRKVFLEFEGMRQAGTFFLNGAQVGLYENGVTAYGIDITDVVVYDGKQNVLAIKIDNSSAYTELSSGSRFEWNVSDFNPNYGGINRRVWLHFTDKIYQTLPVYVGLGTSGTYIYASNFDLPGSSATINVESEVKNETPAPADVILSAIIVDRTGRIAANFGGAPTKVESGAAAVLSTSGALQNANFWSVDDPALYAVYTVLTVNGRTVDVKRTITGFRKTEFKGGVGVGGVYVNDKYVYLKGYAQRSTNEWAGLGQAYPDWMHDYTASQIRSSHANYVRWMHISPQKVDVDAFDRYGIINICPAGDKEGDAVGAQWDQRVAVMRASMIYFRNNPSILFYEGGNSVLSPDHMSQMVALRKQWDPFGGRVIGTRGNSDGDANNAITPIAEYYGVMIGQDPRTDKVTGGEIFRGYSIERRDRAPLIEAEDFRDEGARRYWDDYSPPYFGFTKGPNDTYQYTSESFALAGVQRYWDYWSNRISNPDPSHSKWSGYASIYFSDSDADGRQDSSEVARVSGKVDAVRLPKEIYYAHRVMQNDGPDLHILGHWSYPAGANAKPTVKAIYVISNTESVELIANGKSLGVNSSPESGWVFAFPNVTFAPGTLSALGRTSGAVTAKQTLVTAGAPSQIKLTPIVGPDGWVADGEDVVLIDVEVVDSQGMRVPTDDARIDFTCTGPAIWRGGYNSGKLDSTNNLYLNTELGINRVSVRSTLDAGLVTVTASRPGLESATLQIASSRFVYSNGLASALPAKFAMEKKV